MDAAAEAAVSFAVGTLGNLLVEKVKFLEGVEEQVEELKDELDYMQCFLKDAAEKQANDKRIRKWISDVREVAHDAEDAIETFILRVENERSSRGMVGRCASFPVELHHLDRVGKEIESITRRLTNIQRRCKTYRIKDLGEAGTPDLSREDVERRRRLLPWEKEKHVVGLEEDVHLLLSNIVLNERKGLSVAAIVGMGGIGKSTLARKIYNHAGVADRFERRAWVVVSSEFTREETMKQVLLQLQNSADERLKVAETLKKLEESTKVKLFLQEKLQEMLHKELEGKRYFIVFDDVWKQEHWEYLISVFPDQQDGRLLFTSRHKFNTKHNEYIHERRLLNPDESWDLLVKTAFPERTDGECAQELQIIGREISEKCHRLPLAITVTGGLLVGESKSGWEKVLKQIKKYHFGASDGSNVSAILELSYDNLPPQLKACFLCLGFFEEDASIQANRLVHMWIALGLISPEEVGGEETMEEITMSYLDELINRNLVQVKIMSKYNRVKTCEVHDLLRDLSIRKAKEEIGFELLREEGSSATTSYKPRHRAIHYKGKSPMIGSSDQNKHIRSLFLLNVGEGNYVYLDTLSYLKSFELLKILDIEGIRLPRLPDEIRALIGLRLLRFRAVDSLKLPKWFNHLKSLEVLDIADGVVELPDDETWKMASLRHFYAHRVHGTMKNIVTWENLETLKYFRQADAMTDNPTDMTNCRLRKLGIDMNSFFMASKLRKVLQKMENLEQLHLRWSHYFGITAEAVFDAVPLVNHLTALKLNGRMTRCPDIGMFPHELTHLTLRESRIRDKDPMQVMGKLPKLSYLKLSAAYMGEEMRVLHDGFPSLNVLSLEDMIHLRIVHKEEGGMPLLKRLDVNYCPNLTIDNSQVWKLLHQLR